MNKKFKELANKAGFSSCTKTMQAMLDAYGELIVKECAVIAEKLENDDAWTAPVYDIILHNFNLNFLDRADDVEL